MNYSKKRSRESRAAIERLYVSMRQLLIRGSYKPTGVSGQALIEALRSLQPEIYGSLNDEQKTELDGLLYVAERLPRGIEECAILKMVAREGFEDAGYEKIIPAKRRRNCYRIDKDRMYVEMSRGRSDIYDILTHLTFLIVEAEKIKRHALDQKNRITDNWKCLKAIVEAEENGEEFDEKQALVYLSNVLGRTITETRSAVQAFAASGSVNSLYHFAYWLGELSVRDQMAGPKREIFFSEKLREVIGHHVYGEHWAHSVKDFLHQKGWFQRPVHIISANMHSVMNTIFGFAALGRDEYADIFELAAHTSNEPAQNQLIREFALENGMHELRDLSGTNLTVQIFDFAAIDSGHYSDLKVKPSDNPVVLVMDYAFGEQAFECMDELLKEHQVGEERLKLPVESISIMGKAGILDGRKGDLMIPTAHVFEGTADNYPFDNELKAADFEDTDIPAQEGTMVTVLGTSLQNRDVLYHFLSSTWNAIGLEMEGVHYQKAIQSAARIRHSIKEDVKVRYAYYASDNPLESGSTLSSGGLGIDGIKPAYWITRKILKQILS